MCGIRNEITSTLAASPDIPIPRRHWHGQPIKLYIEHHKSVSVLYADVVNYTHITTQLPVKTLVEVLHELFVKFDQASEVIFCVHLLCCLYAQCSACIAIITKSTFPGVQCSAYKISWGLLLLRFRCSRAKSTACTKLCRPWITYDSGYSRGASSTKQSKY